MVGALICIAGTIYGLLGALHALYTFLDMRNPRRIVPDDPAVITAMQNSTIRLTRGESTMWQGWVGFNLSHSLGALMFAAACFIVTACFRIFAFSPWALFALAAVSALYLADGSPVLVSHPDSRHRRGDRLSDSRLASLPALRAA